MRYPPVTLKKAVVTGCSTGIGAATAHYLRAHGWEVIPTARKNGDLEQLRADGFRPVHLDLADSASVQRAADEILGLCGGAVGALVNNAGFGQMGAVEDLSRDLLRRQFEVNVFGLQELTNRFLPIFRRRGYGRLINISSVLGRVVTPFTGGYCASKYALEALSDALRIELRGTGIAVVLIEPGPIVSAFRRNAAAQAGAVLPDTSRFGALYSKEVERRRRQDKKPDRLTRPPEAVAAVVLRALEGTHPRARYGVTLAAWGTALARRLPTALLDRLLARRVP